MTVTDPNIVNLPLLNDLSIVAHVKSRWEQGVNTTPLGDRGLIQVGHSESTTTTNGTPSGLTEFTSSIFKTMVREQKDQALFLCGDSGSSKSHSYQAIIKEVSILGQTQSKRAKVHHAVPKIHKAVSAFSSASSDSHSHASRILLYQEFQFHESGNLIGVKTLDYGLDKTRVVSVPSGEANFDIFYALLSGASREEKTEWHLHDASHYHYLNSSHFIPALHDLDLASVRQSLKASGVGSRYQQQVFKLLSAILHLGNLQFHYDADNNDESCSVKNRDLLDTIADLLGVSCSNLEFALTYKSRIIQNELCTVFLSVDEAVNQRDAIAKSLYSLLFSWLIERVNAKYCLDDCDTYLGILDIPGFKNSKKGNNLEQFLFNYANEKIRTYTNIRIWNASQVHGHMEGIVSEEGSSIDNSIVELISSSGTGIMAMIDSETARVQSQGGDDKADTRLTDRLSDRFSKTPNFKSAKVVKKKKEVTATLFTITHYGDTPVEYNIFGFVSRNADALSTDLVALFRGNDELPPSNNPFVRSLFSDEVVSTQVLDTNKDIVTSAQITSNPTRKPSTKKKRGKGDVEEEPIIEVSGNTTMLSKFSSSLEELCGALTDAETWVLICLLRQPPGKNDKSWDGALVRKQIAFHGVTSLAKYQSACPYPVSYRYPLFIEKFKGFFKAGANPALAVLDPREVCQQFSQEFMWGPREVAFGATEIFVTQSNWTKLNERLERGTKKSFGAFRPFSDKSGEYAESSFSGDESEAFSDFVDEEPEEKQPDIERGLHFVPYIDDKEPEGPAITPARKRWVCCTWCLTWYMPNCCLSICGGMKRKDIQMAFREKVALNILIYFVCAILLFYIAIFGRLICPKQEVISSFELAGKTDINDPWVSAYGRVYQIKELVNNHKSAYGVQDFMFSQFLGKDVSQLFYKANLFPMYCPGLGQPQAGWDNLISRPPSSNQNYAHIAKDSISDQQKLYLEFMNRYVHYRLAWPMEYIAKFASAERRLIVIFDNVYDVSAYFNSGNPFFGPNVGQLFANFYGKDATPEWKKLMKVDPNTNAYLNCMNNLFYIGTVDHRNDFQCQFSNYILLATSILLVAIIGFKFVAALQCGTHKDPENHDKFVVMLVPCYTEGPESLLKTLESLATLKYDDKRKLLFIIADGMIIGSGNDKPTPQIVLELLGVDVSRDSTPAYSFQSLGEGDKQHNMARVYSGLYHVQGHSVPYIMIAKVGKPSERSRPGNRGKRDTQMILMRFLSRVHFNQPMNPMELEIYHHIQNIIGVNPAFYEYIFMVDADTEVYPDSLNRMISTMIHDSKIIGLCGETLIANEKESWITMMQVYEYFISHHLSKSFESLFGSVTCLPGCFSVYRVRTPTKNIPLLISPSLIKDYSENKVETLHMKNLLHLGEDRYLTTLLMKHFPNLKLSYTPDAKCRTNAPERWSVLKSQRRRWINSTVHNLLELVFLPQLCGFCCFSMRFVVFIDLFSTMVQPVGVLYLGYLFYTLATTTEAIPIISIILLAAIYGFQVIIFILKRQWAQIGWMIIYFLAMPAFSFYLPIYSFWHFDDFSWGNTRVVLGEGNNRKNKFTPDVVEFDPTSIPTRKWAQYNPDRRDSLDSRRNDFASDGKPPVFDSRESVTSGATDDVMSLKSSGTAYSTPQKGRSMSPGIAAPPLSPFRGLVDSRNSPSPGGYASSRATASLYKEYMTPTRGESVYREYAQMQSMAASPTAPSQRGAQSVASNSQSGAVQTPSGLSQPVYPADDALLYQIRLLVTRSDLMTMTKRQVREELSTIFGIDMTPKKSTINYFLEEVLKGTL